MDLLASCIAFLSVRKSSQPPDRDHAFGHGKYEDASGLIEAILIVIAAGIIIWEAVSRLFLGDETQPLSHLYLGMIVMGVSAVMNFIVSQKLMKVAKQTESIALESDAWHLRTDVFTSAGVFLGILIIWITGIEWLDLVISIVIALLILKEAYSLIRRSFSDLMDASLPEEEIDKIKEIITRHADQYTNFHGLKTRRAGSDKFVEFHLMMPHAATLDLSHALVSHIEAEIKEEIERVTIIIHLDPCDGRCGMPYCSFSCRE